MTAVLHYVSPNHYWTGLCGTTRGTGTESLDKVTCPECLDRAALPHPSTERDAGHEGAVSEREVTYEVWREHGNGKDVLVQGHLTKAAAVSVFKECKADKAALYPAAPIDFYIVRATTTREKMT